MKKNPYERVTWDGVKDKEYEKVKAMSKKYEGWFFSIGERGDINVVSVGHTDGELYIRVGVRPGKGKGFEKIIPDEIEGYPVYYNESVIRAERPGWK